MRARGPASLLPKREAGYVEFQPSWFAGQNLGPKHHPVQSQLLRLRPAGVRKGGALTRAGAFVYARGYRSGEGLIVVDGVHEAIARQNGKRPGMVL